MEASVKIVLKTWSENKDGIPFVKLRVIHNRKVKLYSIKNYLKKDEWNVCTQEDFDKIMNPNKGRKSEEIKNIYDNYKAIEQKASDIINSMAIFSFTKFEEKFQNKASNWDYVGNAMNEYITELKSDERHGYASSFHSTLVAIKYFEEKKEFLSGIQSRDHENYKKYKNLKFQDITSTWLKRFEKFLADNDKSISTIGIYTRNIRRLFNLAIKEHQVKADYPFNVYQPKTSTNKKKALTIEQINAIANYKTETGSSEELARDLFIFSFLANGMNINDILRLKYKNIDGNQLKFVRYKTKIKRETTEIIVIITDNLRKIIKKHGNKAINNNVYIFPVLSTKTDESEIYRLIKQKNHHINSLLKKIAKNVGIEPQLANKISTNFARHSYATILKNSGESISFIQESLGHENISTTEKYLSSFDIDHRKKTSEKLDKQIKIS